MSFKEFDNSKIEEKIEKSLNEKNNKKIFFKKYFHIDI